MKICMLSTGHGPLDDRIYYKEVLSLTKRYSQITLVMPGEKSDFQNNRDPRVSFVPLKKPRSLLGRFLVIPQAVKTVLKLRPDIIHFHDYELIFSLSLLRFFSNAKIVYDVHEVYPEMVLDSPRIPPRIKPIIAKLVYHSEKCFSRMAECIITADDSIRVRFEKFHENVNTIFNYPRLSIFSVDDIVISKLKHGYKNRTPIIYNGGMSRNKGLFLMIKAMEILRERKRDVILLLVGSMTQDILGEAERQIQERDLKENIKILGWIPHKEIVNYISISRVGLVCNLPTKKLFKNISIKQFEYMACGVPVLGSDLPPVASYINQARCGKVFDPNSSEALAEGVIDILDDDDEWKRMSESGMRAVQTLWNWGKTEKKLFSIYENLDKLP